jgi:hypothetical protein
MGERPWGAARHLLVSCLSSTSDNMLVRIVAKAPIHTAECLALNRKKLIVSMQPGFCRMTTIGNIILTISD